MKTLAKTLAIILCIVVCATSNIYAQQDTMIFPRVTSMQVLGNTTMLLSNPTELQQVVDSIYLLHLRMADSLHAGSITGKTNWLELQDRLITGGRAEIGGRLDVTGSTGIDSDFDVNTNKFTINAATGNTAVAGTFDATGATTLGSTLGVTGATTLGNTLGVTGATTLNNTLNATGATTLGSTLGVAGATTLASTLNATGATTLGNTLSVTGATTLNGTLDVAGGIGIDSDFSVNNNFTIDAATGNTAIAGTFDATGATTLGSTLGVTGATTLGNTLGVTGATTISNTLDATGATTLGSTLGVTGPATLSNTLDATGATTLGSTLDVTGATGIDGNFDVATNKLTVNATTGNTAVAGTLGVTGATTLDNTLTVKGQTTFDIDISGAQTAVTSYPVLITGSEQGLAINLTATTTSNAQSHRGNNYISFWRSDTDNGTKVQKGRIEAMGRSDLDPTGLVELIPLLIGQVPSFLTSLVSLDPLASLNNENSNHQLGSIQDIFSFNGGTLPSLTGGALAQLTGEISLNEGLFPTYDFVEGLLPSFTSGILPSLNEGTPPSLFGGSFPHLTSGTYPSLSIPSPDFWNFDFDNGSFPGLAGGGFPSLNQGAFPTLNVGALAELVVGELPSFTQIGTGTLPSLTNTLGINSGSFPTLLEGALSTFSLNDLSTITGVITNPIGTAVMDPFKAVTELLVTGSPSQAVWNTFKSSLVSSNVYPADATNFESQIFSNYTLDMLLEILDLQAEFAKFATSLASAFDPEDVFAAVLTVLKDCSALIVYGAYADINLGVAYESGSGDYAEWLERADHDEELRGGEVVGVIGGKVSKSYVTAERFLVVSTAPIVLGNMPESKSEEAQFEKVAFLGQVPVQVLGAVEVGDYILPSGEGDGFGIAVKPKNMLARDYKRIVGVAWENGDKGHFVNVINTAVGVNQNDLALVIDGMQATMNRMQGVLEKLDEDFVANYYDVSNEKGGEMLQDAQMTLSSSHPSHVSSYFEGIEYANKDAVCQGVRGAIEEHTNVSWEDFPLVDFILSHHEHANEFAMYYNVQSATIAQEISKKRAKSPR